MFYTTEEYNSFFKLIDNDFYLKFTKKQFPEGSKRYKNISLKKLDSEKLEESFNEEYRSIDITYSFDKYGYRIYPKLNRPTSKNIFCFGCSYTFGHGIPDEHTWPYILAKKLGEDYTPHNYGVAATSFKSMGRRLYQVLNSNPVKPDHIFLLLPNIFRHEYIGNIGDAPIHIDILMDFRDIFNTKEAIEDLIRRMKAHELFEPNNEIRILWYAYTSVMNCFFDMVHTFNFIEEICSNRNISWSWSSWAGFYRGLSKDHVSKYLKDNTSFEYDHVYIPDKVDLARDNSHGGEEFNKLIANNFYNIMSHYRHK
jgi:hypothetical protein